MSMGNERCLKKGTTMLCFYYPSKDEDSGGVCGRGSEISGEHPCTKEDEGKCQWAKESSK